MYLVSNLKYLFSSSTELLSIKTNIWGTLLYHIDVPQNFSLFCFASSEMIEVKVQDIQTERQIFDTKYGGICAFSLDEFCNLHTPFACRGIIAKLFKSMPAGFIGFLVFVYSQVIIDEVFFLFFIFYN